MSEVGTKLPIQNVRSPVAYGGKADNICSAVETFSVLTHCDIGWIEMPQRGSLLPYRGVLSFRSKAWEASGSETPRVHHAARRGGGGVAARRASTAGIAGGRVSLLRIARSDGALSCGVSTDIG